MVTATSDIVNVERKVLNTMTTKLKYAIIIILAITMLPISVFASFCDIGIHKEEYQGDCFFKCECGFKSYKKCYTDNYVGNCVYKCDCGLESRESHEEKNVAPCKFECDCKYISYYEHYITTYVGDCRWKCDCGKESEYKHNLHSTPINCYWECDCGEEFEFKHNGPLEVSGDCKEYCKACGKETGKIKHKDQWGTDDNEHWRQCSQCLRIDETTRAKHSTCDWVNADEGIHYGTCDVCKKFFGANHSYEEKWYPSPYFEDVRHYRKCTICLLGPSTQNENHFPPKMWTYVDSSKHEKRCPKCNFQFAEELHNYTWQRINDTFHKYKCNGCTDVKVIERHEGNYEGPYDDESNDEKHYYICGKCKVQKKWEDHSYGEWKKHDNIYHVRTCTGCGHKDYQTHEGNYGPWLYHNSTTHKKICSKCQFVVALPHDFPDDWLCVNQNCPGKTCTSMYHQKTCFTCTKADGSHYQKWQEHTYKESFNALHPEFIVADNCVKYYAHCEKTTCGPNHKRLFMTDTAPKVAFAKYPTEEQNNVTCVFVKWAGFDNKMKMEKGFKNREMPGTPLEELVYTFRLYKDNVCVREIELPRGGKNITEAQVDVREYKDQPCKLKFSIQVKDNCPHAPGGGLLSKEMFSPEFWVTGIIPPGGGRNLSYTEEIFMESALNDGSIPTIKEVTLINDKFRAEGLRPGIDYTVENVPGGLTLVATRKSDRKVELKLEGYANPPHDSTADTDRLTIKFENSAFMGGNAAEVEGCENKDMKVRFISNPAPRLIYQSGAFEEGPENNGSVPTEKKITLYNEKFVNVGEFVLNTHFKAYNVPHGLKPKVTRVSDTEVIFKLDERAHPHNEHASTDELGIEFKNEAFVGGNASQVKDYQKDGMSVIFRNAHNPGSERVLIYEPGPFTEGFDNDGGVGTEKTVTLVNGKFKIGPFNSTHYSVANVPIGLTFKVERKTPTEVKLSFTGRAEKHEANDSIYNLTIQFKDAAFDDGILAADVEGSTNSRMEIWFNNTPGDEPELTTEINATLIEENPMTGGGDNPITGGEYHFVSTKGGYGMEINQDVIISSDEETFSGSGYDVYLTSVEPILNSIHPEDNLTSEYYIIRTNGDFDSCNYFNDFAPMNTKLPTDEYNEMISKIDRGKHCVQLIYKDDDGNENLVSAYGLKLEYAEGDTTEGMFKFKLPPNSYSAHNYRKIYFAKDAPDGDYSVLLVVKGKVKVRIMEGDTEREYEKEVRGYRFMEDVINIKGVMYDDDAPTIKR